MLARHTVSSMSMREHQLSSLLLLTYAVACYPCAFAQMPALNVAAVNGDGANRDRRTPRDQGGGGRTPRDRGGGGGGNGAVGMGEGTRKESPRESPRCLCIFSPFAACPRLCPAQVLWRVCVCAHVKVAVESSVLRRTRGSPRNESGAGGAAGAGSGGGGRRRGRGGGKRGGGSG